MVFWRYKKLETRPIDHCKTRKAGRFRFVFEAGLASIWITIPSFTGEKLQCVNKEVESVLKQKASGLDKRREKYNDYTPEER